MLDKARKGTDFLFQFSGYDTSVLLGDIEIKFRDSKVTHRVASAHWDFHVKGFTVICESVEGADSYLVSRAQSIRASTRRRKRGSKTGR